MSDLQDKKWLQRAVDLAHANVAQGGRPFGALLVANDQVLVEAVNEIHLSGDPTAHAEMLAIRAASRRADTRMSECVIYASGQPCPMCLAAMYLSGISRVVFATSNETAEPFGLSTATIYQQMALPLLEQKLAVEYLQHPAMPELYRVWKSKSHI